MKKIRACQVQRETDVYRYLNPMLNEIIFVSHRHGEKREIEREKDPKVHILYECMFISRLKTYQELLTIYTYFCLLADIVCASFLLFSIRFRAHTLWACEESVPIQLRGLFRPCHIFPLILWHKIEVLYRILYCLLESCSLRSRILIIMNINKWSQVEWSQENRKQQNCWRKICELIERRKCSKVLWLRFLQKSRFNYYTHKVNWLKGINKQFN